MLACENVAKLCRTSAVEYLVGNRESMIGFEIIRNGKKALVAGGESLLSLSAVIAAYGKLGVNASSSADPFGNLTVLGVSKVSEQNAQQVLTWEDDVPLAVGDVITVRFIQVDHVSAPRKVEDVSEEQ